MLVNVKSQSKKWHDLRNQGVGGSEIGVVLGLNKYKSVVELYNEKTAAERIEIDSIRMRFGTYAEDFVISEFEKETGLKTEKNENEFYYMEKSVLRGTPDAFYYDDTEKCVLEIKTTSMYIDINEINNSHYLQLQSYLGLTGLKKGKIAYFDASHTLKTTETIDFDAELFEYILKEVERFWDCVMNLIPPIPKNKKDVELIYLKAKGVIEANDVALDICDNLNVLKSKEKSIKKQIGILKDELAVIFGENDTLTFGGNILGTYKTQETNRFNSTKFKNDNKDLYQEYSEVSKSRVLRIK